MNIAIIGSREGFTQQQIINQLDLINITSNDLIITGGARGVDTYAEIYALENSIPYKIIKPNNPTNKQDYILRNIKIVNEASLIIAFHNGISKGTAFVINYCKAKNKNLIIIPNQTTTLHRDFPRNKNIS